MIAGVADTHVAIWFFSGDPRLSASAKNFFFRAASARERTALSSISLAEVVYLVEKQRLPAAAYSDLKAALADPNHLLEEAVLDSRIVDAMTRISRTEIPDMPDRIVAATALSLGVPLVTRDERIRASSIRTVW
jgi:PIN domain nuclease of toxin-antitoxin system